MSGDSKAVFLSYASEDTEAAQRIAGALRAAGVEVWLDKSELRGGDAWDRNIRDQIHRCRLFVPIISVHSEARDEGYFRREWSLAEDRSRDMAHDRAFLVPIVIDETPERGARVPERFLNVQWTRMLGGAAPPAFIERIQRLLAPEATVTQAPAVRAAKQMSGRAAAPAHTSRRVRVGWTVGLLAIAAALGLFALERFQMPKPAPIGSTAPAPAMAAVSGEKSIAVLPFVDLSEKHDQEYFADGMSEEILNLLAKIPALKVIGRTSSFQFKGRTEDLRKVGASLGAAFLLEGSIGRSGQHIRVTAQLINALDGTHRWSETYDREFSDALAIQEDIATNLVRELRLEVAPAAWAASRVQPKSAEAYDAFLKGLHAFNKFDRSDFSAAIADFNRTLQLDPQYVPAAEMLARALCGQPTYGFVPPRPAFELARKAARDALTLDPQSTIGHATLGCVAIWYDWDWASAQRELDVALRLGPSEPYALMMSAALRTATGKWPEGEQLINSATEADPLLASAYQIASWLHLRAGNYSDAERDARRSLEISPSYIGAHRDLALALLLQDRFKEAAEAAQGETKEGGRDTALILAYDALHQPDRADPLLHAVESQHGGEWAFWIAEIYAHRHQPQSTVIWLERAYKQKDIYLWSIKGDPLFKSMEPDPRYQAFLRKMNLP